MLAWASCKDNKAQQNAAPPPTPVSVYEAQKADAVYYDQYQASVISLNNVELRSEVSGFITGIFFKEGDVVPKGKALYEIDRRKYQAAYSQAEANLFSANANLVKAQKDVDRYNMLLKNDAVARQTVDQAQATYETSKGQVEVAKAGVLSAKTDLSYSIITAPVTGRIGISQVKLGAQVSVGSTLLNTISSENPIGVDVVINEQDIDRFYALQKRSTDTTFKLQLSDGVTTYSKPGKVLAIDRGVNNQTGTIKVRIQFPNEQATLKDGMSCVLKVLNNQSGNRVQIPYKAISEQMGEFFVFVSQDTIAKQRKVTLGPRVGSNVVIMNGVNVGDKVITDGFQRLRDGGKITLGNPAAEGAPGAQGKQQAK
jgi:membrane fusion protein (multidrug efflux system)